MMPAQLRVTSCAHRCRTGSCGRARADRECLPRARTRPGIRPCAETPETENLCGIETAREKLFCLQRRLVSENLRGAKSSLGVLRLTQHGGVIRARADPGSFCGCSTAPPRPAVRTDFNSRSNPFRAIYCISRGSRQTEKAASCQRRPAPPDERVRSFHGAARSHDTRHVTTRVTSRLASRDAVNGRCIAADDASRVRYISASQWSLIRRLLRINVQTHRRNA